jgi:hypothetical protein
MKRKNDENCVVANMYAVFWFNKQNEFEKVWRLLNLWRRPKISLVLTKPS